MSYILWDQNSGQWALTEDFPPVGVYGKPVDVQHYAELGDWDTLAGWGIYQERLQTGVASLGYEGPYLKRFSGSQWYAYREMYGTDQERADTYRSQLSDEIETNRIEANIPQINLAADPALRSQLDEANGAAVVRQDELDAADDTLLEEFDTSLDPTIIGAVAVAQSLITQEVSKLSDPSLTTDQVAEVQASIDAHQAIVDAGDDEAEVPAPTSAIRLDTGVIAEDLGVMVSGRIESGGWWYPVFELQAEREISIHEHFIAIYTDAAADDASDTTTGYLSTVQMVDQGDGIYTVSGTDTSLPRNKDFAFKFVLCDGHLSKPWFDKILLAGDVEKQKTRVRWSGSIV